MVLFPGIILAPPSLVVDFTFFSFGIGVREKTVHQICSQPLKWRKCESIKSVLEITIYISRYGFISLRFHWKKSSWGKKPLQYLLPPKFFVWWPTVSTCYFREKMYPFDPPPPPPTFFELWLTPPKLVEGRPSRFGRYPKYSVDPSYKITMWWTPPRQLRNLEDPSSRYFLFFFSMKNSKVFWI